MDNKGRKRILLISFEYPLGKRYCGGVGHVVQACRETLLGMGHEVFVMMSAEFLKKSPLKVLYPDGTVKKYSNYYRFQKEFRVLECDYIIQHFVNWSGELAKIKHYRGKRPKIIYHFHSILRREKDSGFKTLNRFLLSQERMIALADIIICPSRYEYNNFMQYFPDFREKVVLMENTVNMVRYDKKAVENLKKTYRINGRDILALYVGRIELIKGAHILIRYLPTILRRHKNLKVIIIGKAHEQRLYKKLRGVLTQFPHQLFYIKYLDKATLFQYYYLSHIYINTSLSESFSLSTHEAALCDNALLLMDLPVFEKFKKAALFFTDYTDDGQGFISQFERLVSRQRQRHMLAEKAKHMTKRALRNSDLTQSFNNLIQ